ncbi:YcaO-like family protein [Pseudomonas aeruginosa]|nr:YcaO-like family protein [Pseudomonas aeruginosa]
MLAGIRGLEEQGFPVLVKDASLGGEFPVMCVTLMNPRTGGVFASFGAHPSFEVALERSLTELLQGRSFEGLNDLPQPTFESHALTEPNNFVEHFIDSSGVVSWRFFSAKADSRSSSGTSPGRARLPTPRKPRPCSASSKPWASRSTWRCTSTSALRPAGSWCRATRKSIRWKT